MGRERYLVYKDELTVKGKVSIAKEKENDGRYPYHSKQEIKKNFLKKIMFLQKRYIFFQRERARTLQGGKYLQENARTLTQVKGEE